MKRVVPVFFALLLLTACGKAKEIDPAAIGPKLLEEAGFPDTMASQEGDMLSVLYQIDPSMLSAYYVSVSGGATADELVLLTAAEESDVQTLYDRLSAHLQDRTESFAAYLPEEAGKLENAILETYGQTVVLCICNDPDAARAILEK